ncbi:hypothetical protein CANARDRAFT_166854 [[Candida] arabinofermentans NRRL YB-2248]|uniref:TEA domain-containing protein n=1 Tax=[Candida] arabinofermentans NRRL YB-2248 TaxID=983967 RepID=A0A1E4SZH7_9ASCO|nr:hypothetical protein CANARDRAFT_166854 [[Candida] arabinofermentans NRRL YB-2248]
MTSSRPLTGSSAPLIVDISFDQTSGEQIYQVTDNNRTSTTSTSKSTSTIDLNSENSFSDSNEDTIIEDVQLESDNTNNPGLDPDQDQEIWSTDVELAFKESLSIIPKSGLTKIKINGRSCGRNELISDYILTKTGKFRTRKQISSHIQVIKNTQKGDSSGNGNGNDLIHLIVNGPPTDSKTKKKFDDIFGKISIAKSIGSKISSNNTEITIRKQQPIINLNDLLKINLSFKDFKFQYIEAKKHHTFTHLLNDFMKPPLRIRTNANLQNRFPDLFSLIDSIKLQLPNDNTTSTINSTIPPIPILHGMIKMTTPDLKCLSNQINGNYTSYSKLSLTDLPTSDKNYSVLTIIYSFGKQILTTFERLQTPSQDLNLKLAPSYWKPFFNGISNILENQNEKQNQKKKYDNPNNILSKAINEITMKQVIFNDTGIQIHKEMKLEDINKLDIRCVLLWEFLRVEDAGETTLRRIHLPLYTKNSDKPLATPVSTPTKIVQQQQKRTKDDFTDLPKSKKRKQSKRNLQQHQQQLHLITPPTSTNISMDLNNSINTLYNHSNILSNSSPTTTTTTTATDYNYNSISSDLSVALMNADASTSNTSTYDIDLQQQELQPQELQPQELQQQQQELQQHQQQELQQQELQQHNHHDNEYFSSFSSVSSTTPSLISTGNGNGTLSVSNDVDHDHEIVSNFTTMPHNNENHNDHENDDDHDDDHDHLFNLHSTTFEFNSNECDLLGTASNHENDNVHDNVHDNEHGVGSGVGVGFMHHYNHLSQQDNCDSIIVDGCGGGVGGGASFIW